MKYAAYTTTLFCLALVLFALSFVLATVFADLVTLGGLVIDPSASSDPTGERFDPALTTQAHLETVLVALGLMAQGLLGVAGVITVLVMLGIAGLCLTEAVGEQAPPMPEPGATGNLSGPQIVDLAPGSHEVRGASSIPQRKPPSDSWVPTREGSGYDLLPVSLKKLGKLKPRRTP